VIVDDDYSQVFVGLSVDARKALIKEPAVVEIYNDSNDAWHTRDGSRLMARCKHAP
jgi:hypothetical protein